MALDKPLLYNRGQCGPDPAQGSELPGRNLEREREAFTGSEAEDLPRALEECFVAECVLSRLGRAGELVRGGAAATEKGLV